jgi:shikimate dehydrogenase
MTFTQFLTHPDAKNPHYLLIGNPVSHSVSPIMHNTALDHYSIEAKYIAVSVGMRELPTLLAHFNSSAFLGANITIPHKEHLLDGVDELSPIAQEVGAINTILKINGRLVGDNTDVYGFSKPMEDFIDEIELDRAIVFGSGGATKAILTALNDLGFDEVCMVSRRPEKHTINNDSILLCSYDDWHHYGEDASLIINATPLGMTPNIEASPIRNEEVELLRDKISYDIVYTPRETKFLKQAKSVDGITIGGLDMLIYQAAQAFKLWTEKEFPIGLIKLTLDDYFPD